jgi:hypothetical protein
MGWRVGKKENIMSKPYFEDGDGQPNRPSWPQKEGFTEECANMCDL